MSRKFEWYTEEEVGQVARPPVGSVEGRRPARWLWRRLRRQPLFLALLLLVGGVGLVYHQASQRLETTRTAVTADVLSSYTLLQAAVEQGDAELFHMLLSGNDPAWTQAQHRLLTEELLFDRWSLGLALQPNSTQVLTVTTSPDLMEAEVVLSHSYLFEREDGEAETAILQQTAVFRRGAERWLLAPPRPDFWGEWQTADDHLLTLVYPRRDATMARRLLADLNVQLVMMCRTLPDIECPRDLHLTVRLDRDPATLAATADPTQMLTGDRLLDLPTPSLVGLPTSEAGYQALRRGYARHVLAAAIAQATGWRCCEQGLFFQALLERQLSQLGLQSWPLTPADYDAMFREPVTGVLRLYRLWNAPPGGRLRPGGHLWPAYLSAEAVRVYSVIEFLWQTQPNNSAAAMQRRLVTAENYQSWLQAYLPLSNYRNHVPQRQWLRFAQSRLPADPPPLPLPAQDLLVLCNGGAGRTSTLYRYDLSNDSWTPELADRPMLFMSQLWTDDGVLIQERQPRLNQSRVFLWQNGREIELFSLPYSAGLSRVDVMEPAMLLHGYDFSGLAASQNLLYLLLCGPDGCRNREIAGRPFWSPDGRHTLVSQSDGQLWLADSVGQLLWAVDRGIAPFWLDETTYGYVAMRGTQRQYPALMIGTVTGGPPQEILSLEALADETPVSLENMTVRTVVTSPRQPDLLFIAVGEAGRWRRSRAGTLIFAYDLSTGGLSLRLHLPYNLELQRPLLFSPDGRWLTSKSFAPGNSRWQLHLHDVVTGQTRHGKPAFTSDHLVAFPGFDWSAVANGWYRWKTAFYASLPRPLIMSS